MSAKRARCKNCGSWDTDVFMADHYDEETQDYPDVRVCRNCKHEEVLRS